MNTTFNAILFSLDNIQSKPNGTFLCLDREWWALIIQLIVGVITAFAVIYASHKALKWSKQNIKTNERKILNYYLGNLKLLRAGISFYMALSVGALDNVQARPEQILSELKNIYAELHSQKTEISLLLPTTIDIKSFLNLLLIIGDLLYEEKDNPEEDYTAWQTGERELEKIIASIEKSRL